MESARVNQINNMETKQKTWEDCSNEVAQKYDCSDWEMLMLNLKQPDIRKTEFEVTKEAAELFNQETAKERDSYKSGAEQWKDTSKYQEDEINKLREERDALQKELADTQINLSTVEEDNERLKDEINLQLKDNAKSLEELAVLKVQNNSLGVRFDKETERWQERDQNERAKIDSLKQLNSELIEHLAYLKSGFDSLVEDGDGDQRWLEGLSEEIELLLSKASDGYTKAKD